jgi:hypothetical protein
MCVANSKKTPGPLIQQFGVRDRLAGEHLADAGFDLLSFFSRQFHSAIPHFLPLWSKGRASRPAFSSHNHYEASFNLWEGLGGRDKRTLSSR